MTRKEILNEILWIFYENGFWTIKKRFERFKTKQISRWSNFSLENNERRNVSIVESPKQEKFSTKVFTMVELVPNRLAGRLKRRNVFNRLNESRNFIFEITVER